MATTTTNYAFDVPTSSDLVKNGATAIAELGQDIDTFLFRPFGVNAVLNSAFQVWQRGTSFTAATATTGYTADRWLGYRSVAGGTISRQATGDTTNLPNIQYCARIARDSGNTSTATINYYNAFDSVNSIPYAGKTVTLSFYARKGANYSSTTTNVLLTTGTGTDQNVVSGFTGASNVISSTLTPTTTWARYTYTATLATTTTQLSIAIIQNPLGTAGAADYLEITGVQLEVGSAVATPFKTNQPTYATELVACQRYYWRTTATAGTPYSNFGTGLATSTTNGAMYIQNPVPMRVAPTSVDFANTQLNDGITITGVTNVALATNDINERITHINATVASGLTQYRPYILGSNNSATGYFGLSAEL